MTFHLELRDALFTSGLPFLVSINDVPKAWELYSRAGSITRLCSGKEQLPSCCSALGQSVEWLRHAGQGAAKGCLLLYSAVGSPLPYFPIHARKLAVRPGFIQRLACDEVGKQIVVGPTCGTVAGERRASALESWRINVRP